MRYLVLLLLAGLVQPNVLADEDERRYNLIRLQAERAEQVANDTMHVSLNTYGEDRDAAQLAARINADMAWALKQAGLYKMVKAKTGSYRTWPVERDKILTRAGAGSRTWNWKAPISRR